MKAYAIGIFLALGVAMFSYADDDAHLSSIVKRYYPAELTAFAQECHEAEKRQQAFATVESHDVEYVVAAYSGAQLGAVVLLERSGDKYTVDQTIVGNGMDGSDPRVKVVGGDDEQPLLIVVSFTLPRGGDDWIYRLANHRLQLVNPTDSDESTMLGNIYLLDFGDKGPRHVVETSVLSDGGEDLGEQDNHYVLKNGKYVATTPLDFFKVLYRDKPGSDTVTEEFSIPASLVGKPFKMTVINGSDSDKAFRVSKFVITLNRVKLSSGDDSSEHGSWTVPVSLQQQNTITVEMRGDPRGRLAIAIYHE